MAQLTICRATMMPMTLIGLLISAGPGGAADSNPASGHLGLKAGWPLHSQPELDLPYDHARRSQLPDSGAEPFASGSGVGDLTVGLAETLVRERGWRPDLIGRLNYGVGNARSRDGNPVFLGSGFRHLQAGLVALKRQDRLSFVASAFYNKFFEQDQIRPGDAIGFSLAAVLAASPAISLQTGFAQIIRRETESNGVKSPGSRSAYGMFSIGASSMLVRDVIFNTQLGIGLGNDAPKYSLTVSLPVAF